jgi:O-antigen/teichoic acid export membrane protein
VSRGGEPTLGALARSGARWAASAYYVETIVRFGISIALARLLAPADFGVMALAMTFVGFVALMQDSGLSSALVQHPEPVAPAASTVLVLTTLGGVLLAGASWVLAPVLAAFAESPEATPLVRALGVLFLVRGVSNPARALLQRAMGFRALAAVEVASTAAYGATGLAIAAAGSGVWALVVAQIVSELVTAALLWSAMPFRPRLADFDLRQARGLGRFGRHMVAASLLGMLHLQLPTLLAGKLLGAEVLGLYWVSFRWAQLPIQGLTFVANQIAYPVYARLRHDPGRFSDGYLRVLQTILLLAVPTSIGLALSADAVIGTLYDARWAAAVAPLRILAFYGLFAAIAATTGEVFKGAGVPRWVSRYAVLYNLLIAVGLVVLGRTHGVEGIAWATVLAPLIVSAVALRRVAILLGLPMRRILALLVTPVQGTLAMAVVVMLVAVGLAGASPALRLAAEATAGALTYAAVLYWLEPAWCREAAATVGIGRARPERAEDVVA